MTGFVHNMPFGAEVRPDGSVRFRLWAPDVQQVWVDLSKSDARLAMRQLGDGWFELVTGEARPGSLYRFTLPDGTLVPDPASRAQDGDPDGASRVIDPASYHWKQTTWAGRPWQDAVLYEIHTGTFTREGTFTAIRNELPRLAALGITAIELMPIADFKGQYNWGYDGVLFFAPDARYGTPDELKELIDEAHMLDLMIVLDVVYNHFGPEGNFLHQYAQQFFTQRFQTPWGSAIDYSRSAVRDFVIHNALYWLEEYRFDGLRFDAVHAIFDDSTPPILEELAQTVRRRIGDREIHLILENDDNRASLLRRDDNQKPIAFTAQWNDDFHHAAHVILTRETDGYYNDYAEDRIQKLARGLAEGFIYQGDPSPFRHGQARGEPTDGLTPDAFVDFLQNHDQIGNRAFGDRLIALTDPAALSALRAIHLLCPSIPLLFMGEEWNSETPFYFFCDFEGDLAEAVRKGRREEFARFPQFSDPAAREKIPDPVSAETFNRSRLQIPADLARQKAIRDLLELRRERIVPLIKSRFENAAARVTEGGLLEAEWRYAAGTLRLRANLSDRPVAGQIAYGHNTIVATHSDSRDDVPPWFVSWSLDNCAR